MFTKAKIFNLALNALLLQRQIADPETDTSNENKVLNSIWDVAFQTALQDMDLDSLSLPQALELLATDFSQTDDENRWMFTYKYPTNCALLRRVRSTQVVDSRYSHVPKRVGLYKTGTLTIKAIFTNQENAVIEMIPTDFPISAMDSSAVACVATKLAFLAAPLIVGKGADKLRMTIAKQYTIDVANAKETDRVENTNFESEETQSEFVAVRLS